MLGRVQIGTVHRGVGIDSEGDERVERGKNDGRIYHSVIVKFAHVFCHGDAALIEARLIHLHADANVLQDGVDDADPDPVVVLRQAGQQVRQAMDVVVLDVPRGNETMNRVFAVLLFVPIQLPNL